MNNEKRILDKNDIKKIIKRISIEILEKHKKVKDLALIGIHTRGVFIAKRIQDEIFKSENELIPTGDIDINLYRDDWTRISHQPIVKPTKIKFSVDNKKIILVDDVLFTGRTIRAAIDALMDYGRPDIIELAVLADRGHRELPIQPDYIGKFIDTRHSETINVMLSEFDGKDQVVIFKKG